MKRNCPHCGQEQQIPEDEIVAPWVFMRCPSCAKLSILKKEGAPAVPRPKRAPEPAAKSPTRRGPESLRALPPRSEAVIGAFASGVASEAVIPPATDREWELPAYFSPFPAESEEVFTLRVPPQAPAFLKKRRLEMSEALPIAPESVFEPLAAALAEANVEMQLASESPASGSADSSASNSGAAPPPSSPNRRTLIGVGTVLIGMGCGLLGLRAWHRTSQPSPPAAPVTPPVIETSAVIPQPSKINAPAPASVIEPIRTPGPGDHFTTAPGHTDALWVVRIVGNKAVLRSGPGKDFKSLGQIESGSRWVVRKWESDWFEVEPENMGPGTLGIGWVRNDLAKAVNNGGGE
jgi:hypothetical protein